MSGNKLLTENTVRRFMKLANVDSLTDRFVAEAYAKKEDEIQKEASEEEETLEEQEAPEEEPAMDEPAAEEDEDMEMDMGDEPDDDMGAADISLTEEEASLLIDLGERLKEAMGDDEDMDMDDEPEMDMEEEPEMPEDDAGADMEDEPGMRPDPVYENQDEIVQEVLRRVTKRIVAEKLKNK